MARELKSVRRFAEYSSDYYCTAGCYSLIPCCCCLIIAKTTDGLNGQYYPTQEMDTYIAKICNNEVSIKLTASVEAANPMLTVGGVFPLFPTEDGKTTSPMH